MSQLRTTVIGAACALAVLAAEPAAAQEGEPSATTWGVAPSSQDGPDGRAAFDYALDPGETLIDFVGVSNFGSEPITVDLYASDAYTTEAGAFDLLPSDAEPVGVGSWIGFNDQRLTVEPGQRLDVPFALAVPDTATPGDHVGGIVAAVTEAATDDSGNAIEVERRVGARVHLRVSGELDPNLVPEIEDETYHYEWNPFAPGSTGFEYTVANAGNVRLQGELVARVSGPWGVLEREVHVAELPQILPGDSYSGTAELDRIWPLARVEIELLVRPEPVAEADAEVVMPTGTDTESLWAPPWPQAAVAAVLVLATWTLLRIRKRRNAKVDADEPEPEPGKEPIEA
ncbi:hypothetical protein GCM10029992_49440 [Glycomyces albus]